MIFGLFSGHTVASLTRKGEQLAEARLAHADHINQAVADRQAAIREASEEITVLTQLKLR